MRVWPKTAPNWARYEENELVLFRQNKNATVLARYGFPNKLRDEGNKTALFRQNRSSSVLCLTQLSGR